MPIALDEATIDRLARRIVELQGMSSPGPVLTMAEAMRFVRVGSKSALDRWVAKFAPRARCSAGRFTHAALVRGREVEARQFAAARPKRKPAAKAPAPAAPFASAVEERLAS